MVCFWEKAKRSKGGVRMKERDDLDFDLVEKYGDYLQVVK